MQSEHSMVSFKALIAFGAEQLNTSIIEHKGLSPLELEVLTRKLAKEGLQIPTDYGKFLLEVDGFYKPGLCFHGSKPHFTPINNVPDQISLLFSEACNLLDINLRLQQIYPDDMDCRTVIGEKADHLFAFNSARNCYERLTYTQPPIVIDAKTSIDEIRKVQETPTPVIDVDCSFPNLRFLLRELIPVQPLETALPPRPSEFKMVSSYFM